MRTLKGRSGVVHTFSDATCGPDGLRVALRFPRELTEVDVIGAYAKAIDVGPCSVELLAPSATPGALHLLESYGLIFKPRADISRQHRS